MPGEIKAKAKSPECGQGRGTRLAQEKIMKNLILLASLLNCTLTFTTFAHADDFKNAVKKAGKDISNAGKELSKELQKVPIASTKYNPFNREMSPAISPKAGEFWIAVVGDSSATGAAASPNFQPSWLNILGHIGQALINLHDSDLGPGPGYASPYRVMYSRPEFDVAKSKNKADDLTAESDLSQKIDTEEFSFGYALSQKLSMSPNKLVLTGQDGVRISSMAHQFDRIMTVGAGALAPLILVSYVANDLCHPNNFSNTVEHFRADYEAELRRQFERVATYPADPNKTRIVFLAPLDISNVLTNEQLLQQRVRFEGGDVTCRQIRDGAVGGGDLGKMMNNSLIGACRGILAGGDPQVRIAHLKLLQDAQADVIQRVIADFNAKKLAITAEYAPSIKKIDFQVGDLAQDCFHPSKAGGERIAVQLLTNELANVRP